MNTMIKVNFRDLETVEFPKGTTLKDISKEFQKYYNLSDDEAKKARDIFRGFYQKDEYLFKAYVYNGIVDLLKYLS